MNRNSNTQKHFVNRVRLSRINAALNAWNLLGGGGLTWSGLGANREETMDRLTQAFSFRLQQENSLKDLQACKTGLSASRMVAETLN